MNTDIKKVTEALTQTLKDNGFEVFKKFSTEHSLFPRYVSETVRDVNRINLDIKLLPNGDAGKISDGYHTFDELYEHRCRLWIALCRAYSLHIDTGGAVSVWKTKVHSDGSVWDGWFILGMSNYDGKNQSTYHLPISMWDDVQDFGATLDKAPEYDGHTPNDVLNRLKTLGQLSQ